MANLDTRSKRQSHVRLVKPYSADLPGTDGTIAQGDRQHLAWLYSGILASSGAAFNAVWAFGANVILQAGRS
jgi:hypothetical protein